MYLGLTLDGLPSLMIVSLLHTPVLHVLTFDKAIKRQTWGHMMLRKHGIKLKSIDNNAIKQLCKHIAYFRQQKGKCTNRSLIKYKGALTGVPNFLKWKREPKRWTDFERHHAPESTLSRCNSCQPLSSNGQLARASPCHH